MSASCYSVSLSVGVLSCYHLLQSMCVCVSFSVLEMYEMITLNGETKQKFSLLVDLSDIVCGIYGYGNQSPTELIPGHCLPLTFNRAETKSTGIYFEITKRYKCWYDC